LSFCERCGAPLTSYATIDPVKQIKTFGFMFRRLAKGDVNKIVLIGAWLIFLFLLLQIFFPFFKNYSYYELIGYIYSIFIITIFGVLLFFLTKNFIKNKKNKKQ